MNRQDELAANLATLRKRVAAACDAAGRDVGEITVIAVTKTFPASDIRLLAGLGMTQIGENRDSEAAPKVTETTDLDLTWHFVGQLQTRRCRSVSRYASVIHSVDRERLVRVLGREARRAERELTCLVQVSLDGPDAPPGRGGVRPDQAVALAGEIAAEDGLRLGGVMAVAPLGAPARDALPELAAVAGDVRAAHPGATVISAGMSGDLEEAIESGATHLRIGTALLGVRRPSVR
jgi:pyridoxal phosphate enzyme (YggS family)